MRRNVTEREFINVITKHVGEARLYMSTEVKMRKSDNPLRDNSVRKVTRGNFIIGRKYSDLVNESAGIFDFKPGPLKWGKWRHDMEGYIIEHNGERYLRYYYGQEAPDVNYIVDGRPATAEEIVIIHACARGKQVPNTQKAVGLDESTVVKAREVKLSNLFSAEIADTEYFICHGA